MSDIDNVLDQFSKDIKEVKGRMSIVQSELSFIYNKKTNYFRELFLENFPSHLLTCTDFSDSTLALKLDYKGFPIFWAIYNFKFNDGWQLRVQESLDIEVSKFLEDKREEYDSLKTLFE
jgi:hypothetical protein